MLSKKDGNCLFVDLNETGYHQTKKKITADKTPCFFYCKFGRTGEVKCTLCLLLGKNKHEESLTAKNWNEAAYQYLDKNSVVQLSFANLSEEYLDNFFEVWKTNLLSLGLISEQWIGCLISLLLNNSFANTLITGSRKLKWLRSQWGWR